MPEPDCFLRYRVLALLGVFAVVLKWSYDPPLAMGIGRQSQQRRVVLRGRNTFVGGKCALPSALLVVVYSTFVVK